MKGRLSTEFVTPGELIAFQQVDLYAKENSFVKKLSADVGSEVREGQLLAVISTTTGHIENKLVGIDFVVDPGNRRLIGNPDHGGEHILELY